MNFSCGYNIGPTVWQGTVATGKPFRASLNTTVRERGMFGQAKNKKFFGAIYRDSYGRIRNEFDFTFFWSSVKIIGIIDVVAKQIIGLDPKQKHFTLMPFEPVTVNTKLDPSPTDEIVEGYQCRTISFPAGEAIGKAWISLHLQYVLKETIPGDNGKEWRLFDITEEEPDPSLFVIPNNFTNSSK